MKTQIYVNLPVRDLKRSSYFFEKLGFELNPKLNNQRPDHIVYQWRGDSRRKVLEAMRKPRSLLTR
jgi:catechol 2,3-dioxygenase-like lactoylglutathione lyase family enzyme